MATVIERSAGHYEVQEVPFGRSYAWCPDCVVVECDCGERLVLSAEDATCTCGADHAALVHGDPESRTGVGEDPQLKVEHDRWRENQDDYLRSEANYWQEMEALD